MESISMGWPEWIITIMILVALIVRIAKANGWRPKNEDMSNAAWTASCFVYPALWFGMLYWGGFFS